MRNDEPVAIFFRDQFKTKDSLRESEKHARSGKDIEWFLTSSARSMKTIVRKPLSMMDRRMKAYTCLM